ncbi:hypothetical protein BDF19DRAFT_416558 [Syncephalis fuscata]|nr:hypothetical protein BDF19DRAFT_416558 [Syncephalis fuscata]
MSTLSHDTLSKKTDIHTPTSNEQTKSKNTTPATNKNSKQDGWKYEFLDDETMPKVDRNDVYWKRSPVVSMVATKLANWVLRFRKRNGRAAIDWYKDVMPTLALDKQVYLGRGWHPIPRAKQIGQLVVQQAGEKWVIESAVARSMRQGHRVDVFLYAVLTTAAARAGDGEMAWQGLRRLAWLEAVPTNNLYTNVIQRLTKAYEEQEQLKTLLRKAPPVTFGPRTATDLELSVMNTKAKKLQTVLVDRAPHWIEQIALLMKDESEPDNSLTATCRMVACIGNGGLPVLNDVMLNEVIILLENGADEETLDPQMAALLKFEKLFIEFKQANLTPNGSVHGRVLNILLANNLLDYALAWHLRVSQLISWEAVSSSSAVTFSISDSSSSNELPELQSMDQFDEFTSSINATLLTNNTCLPPSLEPCNRLLAALIRAQRSVDAVAVYDDLLRLGAKPDRFTLCIIAFCCAMKGNYDYLRRICADFIRFDLPVTIVFYNSLLSVLVERGDQPAIRQLYSELVDSKNIAPNRRTFNLLLSSCAKIGDAESAQHFYMQLINASYRPNARTFAHLLDLYARHTDVNGATRVMKEMKLRNVRMALSIANSLLSVYVRTANPLAAKRCFQLMLAQPITSKLRPSIVSYLWLFRGYYWEILRGQAASRTQSLYNTTHTLAGKQLSYSMETLYLLKMLMDTHSLSKTAILPESLHVVLMEPIASHNPDVIPDTYFSPLPSVSLQPAINTPWQLFRCMTIHDGLMPNSIIYDTLLETLAIQKKIVEFNYVWNDLQQHSEHDTGLAEYTKSLMHLVKTMPVK